MAYLKVALCGTGGISLGWLIPALFTTFRGIGNQKATGVGAILAVFVSPLCWILTIAFFTFFLLVSRARSAALRLTLFWIPALLASIFVLSFAALFTYLFIHAKTG